MRPSACCPAPMVPISSEAVVSGELTYSWPPLQIAFAASAAVVSHTGSLDGGRHCGGSSSSVTTMKHDSALC